MINPWDVQCGGSHYKDFKIQPAYFCYNNSLGFLEGNVIKYVCRQKESRIQDLKKAKHYLELLIWEEERKLKENERPKTRDVGCDTTGTLCSCGGTIHQYASELCGRGVVHKKFLDRARARRLQGVVDSLFTKISEVHKEESVGRGSVDNITCGVDYKRHWLDDYARSIGRGEIENGKDYDEWTQDGVGKGKGLSIRAHLKHGEEVR